MSRELAGLPRILLDPSAEGNVDSEVKSDIHDFIRMRVHELAEREKYSSRLRSHVEGVFLERVERTFL